MIQVFFVDLQNRIRFRVRFAWRTPAPRKAAKLCVLNVGNAYLLAKAGVDEVVATYEKT